MRVLARLALSAALPVVAGLLAPLAPAHAASGEWVVEAEPTAFARANYVMHKHVDGHPGNWHILSIDVRQDDDGVTGGFSSYRCPKGVELTALETPPASCTQVAGADFVDELGLTVDWTPQLRRMHIYGDIVLNDYFNEALVETSMDIRLVASGERTRTVTRQSFTDPDPWDYKQIDVSRDGVSMRGHVDWLKASPTPETFVRPLSAYWAFSRGYADGV